MPAQTPTQTQTPSKFVRLPSPVGHGDLPSFLFQFDRGHSPVRKVRAFSSFWVLFLTFPVRSSQRLPQKREYNLTPDSFKRRG